MIILKAFQRKNDRFGVINSLTNHSQMTKEVLLWSWNNQIYLIKAEQIAIKIISLISLCSIQIDHVSSIPTFLVTYLAIKEWNRDGCVILEYKNLHVLDRSWNSLIFKTPWYSLTSGSQTSTCGWGEELPFSCLENYLMGNL